MYLKFISGFWDISKSFLSTTRLLGLQRECDDARGERRGGRGARVADGARVVVVGGGDLLVGVGATREGHRHRARALLSVPRELACARENVNVTS